MAQTNETPKLEHTYDDFQRLEGYQGPVWKKSSDQQFRLTEDYMLNRTPSRLHGMSAENEKQALQYNCTVQQHIGQKLNSSQLCINTGCTIMRRAYATTIPANLFSKSAIAATCFFIAAKTEEQPRKIELVADAVLRVKHKLSHLPTPCLEPRRADINATVEEMKVLENVVLKAVGFSVHVDHPHAYVVKGCHMIKASKDFAQTAYFLATNSVHLTYMCVMYSPQTVACVCIYLASKWARYQIPKSTENKDWWFYIDPNLTEQRLQVLGQELLKLLSFAPPIYKRTELVRQNTGHDRKRPSTSQGPDPKKVRMDEQPTTTGRSWSAPTTAPSTSRHQLAREQRSVQGHDAEKKDAAAAPGSAHQHGHPTHSHPRVDEPAHSAPRPGPSHGGIKEEPKDSSESCGTALGASTTVNNIIAVPVKQEPHSPSDSKKLHISQSMPNLINENKTKCISVQDYLQRNQDRAPHSGSSRPEYKEMHFPLDPLDSLDASGESRNMKHIKKEGSSSAASEVHLKEPLIALTDLKDSSGSLYNMYTSAQRRNSTDCDKVQKVGVKSESSSKSKPQLEHSGSHASHRISHDDSKSSALKQDRSRMLPPKEEKESIKLKIRLPQGASEKVKTPSAEKMRTPSTSSEKIRMSSSASSESAKREASVSGEPGGLKMKLQLGGRLSHPSKYSDHPREDSQKRKRKHTPDPYLGKESGTSSSMSTEMGLSEKKHKSSHPKAATSSSMNSSFRPPLKSQHSGFSFDSLGNVPSTLPDMIFDEPDTPDGIPITPTKDNIHLVSSHMQQIYSASQGRVQPQQAMAMPSFSHHIVNQYPPLPPPLPVNPPPPPPPPPK